jgi:hypothetical protein
MKFGGADDLSTFAQASALHANPFLKKTRRNVAPKEYARRKAVEFSILPSGEECDPTSAESTLSCPSETYCLPVKDKFNRLGGMCTEIPPGILINVDAPNTYHACDPDSSDPDVGVLSCAEDHLCVTFSTSRQGGVCVPLAIFNGALNTAMDGKPPETDGPQKRGFFYCDPSSPYFGFLDCDCTGFNITTQEGSFVCSSSYCFGDLSECCGETCADITLTYAGSTESFTYETCYAFKHPYPQTFCYGQTIGGGSSSCFASFNNESCGSCQIYNSTCSRFSCDAAGFLGEVCIQDFYPPILTSCFAACSTCHICPHNPNQAVANEETLVGISDFTCGYVNYLGTTGTWGGPEDSECLNVQKVAMATCCEGITTSPPPTIETTAPTTTVPPLVIEPPEQEPSIPDATSPPIEVPSAATLATAAPVQATTIPPIATGKEDVGFPFPAPTQEHICKIRIETSKCKELVMANSEVIPCGCENQCITFIDDKFDKCDGGSSISGMGSIVAGCTFGMAFVNKPFPCSMDETQLYPSSSSTSITFSAGLVLSMAALSLLAASFMP